MDRQLRIDAAIEEARSYIGVKWRHRGRSRFGVDCIGLIVLALAEAGVHMNDRLDYSRDPWNEGLDREMVDHFGEAVDDMLPGDIVTMTWLGKKEPSHVGMIAELDGALSLIHSYSMVHVCEHRLDSHWKGLIANTYRPFK